MIPAILRLEMHFRPFFSMLQLPKRMHKKVRRHVAVFCLPRNLQPSQSIKDCYSTVQKTKRFQFIINLLDRRTINSEKVMALTLLSKVQREEPSIRLGNSDNTVDDKADQSQEGYCQVSNA